MSEIVVGQTFKKNSYEEAFYGFQEKGLYLDTPKDQFNHLEKSDCHCLKHPNNKMKYAWKYVKLGRFSCKECRKENGYIALTPEEKIKEISTFGYVYIDGDLACVNNALTLECKSGHHFIRTLNNLRRGATSCPFCNGITPISYWNMDTCQKWLNENKSGYTILDLKLQDSKLKVKLQCPNNNHDPYWTDWNHIRHGGTGCKLCYYEKENKTDWTLENAKNYLLLNGYTMLDESGYTSSHNPVYCKDKDGFIYQVRIHFLLRRDYGFSILKNNKYAVHNIRLFMKLYRPDYEFLSNEYHGYDKLYKWRYFGDGLSEDADPVFEQTVGSMLTAYCKHPLLTISQLENQCMAILDKYDLSYDRQKTFDGCVGKIKLRFDFYLRFNNQEYCIETDGLQHDVPVALFGGIKGFEKRQKYDEIKNNYCRDNNINLIRIKQKEIKNMENILVERLGLIKEGLVL